MQMVASLLQQLSKGTNCHQVSKTLQILRYLKTPQSHLYTSLLKLTSPICKIYLSYYHIVFVNCKAL